MLHAHLRNLLCLIIDIFLFSISLSIFRLLAVFPTHSEPKLRLPSYAKRSVKWNGVYWRRELVSTPGPGPPAVCGPFTMRMIQWHSSLLRTTVAVSCGLRLGLITCIQDLHYLSGLYQVSQNYFNCKSLGNFGLLRNNEIYKPNFK